MMATEEYCARCHCLILDREPVSREVGQFGSLPLGSSAQVRGPEHADPVDCVFALQRAATASASSWVQERRQLEALVVEEKAETQRWKSRVKPTGIDVLNAGVPAGSAHRWMDARVRMPDSNLRSGSGDDYTIWVAVDDDGMEFFSSDEGDPWYVANLIEFAHDVTGIDQWRILAEMAAKP